MSHPIGIYISKSEDHELNYWLKKHDFRETDENREVLCDLIDVVKEYCAKETNQHLTHDELNEYFDDYSDEWEFEEKE